MKDGFIKVEVGGKERSLKFNMRAIETFAEIKDKGHGELTASVTLVYGGLIGWCYAKQIEPDFTFEDVTEWVEQLIYDGKNDVLAKINSCLTESRAFEFLKSQSKKKKTVVSR